ncbi:30S ribosomal protein S13 [bacterium (Candidatus Torokbacteria) CG_4_10_14_0_2_um_filter_35_8]|nr:MAG: 30S ribosomal protein S13 [bacterium (Candidatus Torokbacteria) CG_4_10_14_0_2_um_filter_35_8]
MHRILGINVPQEKRIEIALTYIYGVGRSLSNKVLTTTKVDPNKLAKDLTEYEIDKIQQEIEKKYKVEGELRRLISSNIKRLKQIRCYRGIRHIKGLPVRGQRTKTNSRTRRGNVRKTVTSGRRKAAEKT